MDRAMEISQNEFQDTEWTEVVVLGDLDLALIGGGVGEVVFPN